MALKQIKYVGFYDLPESKSDRVCNLAATNKMNYIANSLVDIGYRVEIISPSWMGNNTNVSFEKQKTVKIDKYKKVTFCPSWKTSKKIMRNAKILVALIWLFFYLLFNTKKNEKIIVYHVQWISLPLRAAKIFKGFKIILEVEEVYQDLIEVSNLFTYWENKLLSSADSYLYSTDLLKNRLQPIKPYTIIYGEYKSYNRLTVPNKDGKIHLLYAGIIDEEKRGAYNALYAAQYLSNRYQLHIIGFGDVERLQSQIEEHNRKHECKVQYDGLKSGEEYIRYCQKCHIGLSTQSMSGEYLESSFPSKILSYLALGLRVVSCEIKCVTESKIGDMVTYYSEDDPHNIAEAIKKVNTNAEYDSRKVMQELDKDFVESITNLLEL